MSGWVEAQYADLGWSPIYAGNPFIRAMGPVLQVDAIERALRHDPGVDPTSRQLVDIQRVHRIAEMDRLFFPRAEDLRTAVLLDLLVRQGYQHRNPLDPGYGQYQYQARQEAIAAFRSPRRQTAPLTLIAGPSGTGKTTAMQAIASLQPSAIKHTCYQGEPFDWLQIPIVTAEASFNGTPRGIALDFFRGVDELTGTTTYHDQYNTSRPQNVEILVGGMAQVCATFAIGAIVIDEVQHVENYKTGKNSFEGLDFLIKLSNVLRVPVALAGTDRAVTLLAQRFQDARRVCSGGYVQYKLPADFRDRHWRHRMEWIWKYQWQPTYLPFTDEVAEWYFSLTQAVLSIDVLLAKMVQQRAAMLGASSISKKDFIYVYTHHMVPLHGPLDALRRRSVDPKAIERYEDLIFNQGGLASLLAQVSPVSPVPDILDPHPVQKEAANSAAIHVVPAQRRRSSKREDRQLDPDDLRNALQTDDPVLALRSMAGMEMPK